MGEHLHDRRCDDRNVPDTRVTIFHELVAEAVAANPANESRILPLFDSHKTPNFTGWSGPDWEREAIEWMELGHKPSGSFFWMQGCQCVVFDPEGKNFGRTGYTLDNTEQWPSWLRLAINLADVLPSWVSAGGDGGLGVRNVLLPIGRDALEAQIKAAAARQALPMAEEWRLAARAPLAGVEWGEILTKHGVCIPPGVVDSRKLELGLDLATGQEWTLQRAREAWSTVAEWTIHILAEPLVIGSKERVTPGGADGDVPVMREIEEALVWKGPTAAAEITHGLIRAGASRHYASKTWAEYAYHGVIGRGGREVDDVREGARTNMDDEVSTVIIDQIWEFWAHAYSVGEEPFTTRDVRKAVHDSRRFMFGKRQS